MLTGMTRFSLLLIAVLSIAGCAGDDGASPSGDADGDGENGEDAASGERPAAGTPTVPPGDPGTDERPGDGGTGVGTIPVEPDAVPTTGAAVTPGTTLRADTRLLCPTVGESFELSFEAVAPEAADGSAAEPVDASASVRLTQSFGDSLELLSQGDGAISLRMIAEDVVALRAGLGEASVTLYVGGFAPERSGAVLLKKPVAGGCLYALRLPAAGFCGTALSRGGYAVLGSGGTGVSIAACEHEAPPELPLIELPPEPELGPAR